ncbi:hypothetical protein Droror1_Dr00022100 [Drosera rotundifolia]
MTTRSLPSLKPHLGFVPAPSRDNINRGCGAGHFTTKVKIIVSAKSGDKEEGKEESKEEKKSLFTSITDALDFAQVRSENDALLLDDAREVTQSGRRMTREQYGALRRKIGGTYKDFFKSYVEVDGEYVEEGWVDKTCKVCKKDTRDEPRQVDKLGRYVHVACLEKGGNSVGFSNFFTKFFSR